MMPFDFRLVGGEIEFIAGNSEAQAVIVQHVSSVKVSMAR